jgi:hypothetical protein
MLHLATHYPADYVSPCWVERLVELRKIGVHIFYRWTGAWGQRFSFTRQHSGDEPVIAKMALVTTPLEMLDAPVGPSLIPDPQIEVDTPPLMVTPFQHDPLPEPETQAPAPAPQAARAPAASGADRFQSAGHTDGIAPAPRPQPRPQRLVKTS